MGEEFTEEQRRAVALALQALLPVKGKRSTAIYIDDFAVHWHPTGKVRVLKLHPRREVAYYPSLAAMSEVSDSHPQAQVVAQPRLKVRLTSFPESNGKRNWTALLVREQPWDGLVGNCGGISLAHGELWNRVAYAAQRAMYLIGERDTEPHILDFGDDIETPDQWKGEEGRPARPARSVGTVPPSEQSGKENT